MNPDLADEKNFVSGDPDTSNAEFASIDDKWRGMERVQLEAASDGLVNLGGGKHAARAEIIRRDRDYEQEQERSRRKFETDRDLDREKLEREMSDLADTREAARQKFEEKLAQRQMDHAAGLAKEQLYTAQAAARAAKMAALAAGVAALGTIGQIIVAVLK
jgi:hypothetical protein